MINKHNYKTTSLFSTATFQHTFTSITIRILLTQCTQYTHKHINLTLQPNIGTTSLQNPTETFPLLTVHIQGDSRDLRRREVRISSVACEGPVQVSSGQGRDNQSIRDQVGCLHLRSHIQEGWAFPPGDSWRWRPSHGPAA